MSDCVPCSTELDPSWNYCVNCGAPVVRAEPRARVEPQQIPGAIRPQQPASPPRWRTIPRPAILVIVLAVVGVVGSFLAAALVLR